MYSDKTVKIYRKAKISKAIPCRCCLAAFRKRTPIRKEEMMDLGMLIATLALTIAYQLFGKIYAMQNFDLTFIKPTCC